MMQGHGAPSLSITDTTDVLPVQFAFRASITIPTVRYQVIPKTMTFSTIRWSMRSDSVTVLAQSVSGAALEDGLLTPVFGGSSAL